MSFVASVKQRTDKGDLVPILAAVQGDVLMIKSHGTKPQPWSKASKLLRPSSIKPDEWLQRDGRQLKLNDSLNRPIALLLSSDEQAAKWEKALLSAAEGCAYRRAASLLRSVRKVLQMLVWGQNSPAELALDLVQVTFEELIEAKQLYLAFHLLSIAEHYIKFTRAGHVSLTRQWECLRKKVASAATKWQTIETTDSFGIEDPFWGYKDPENKMKTSWDPLQTIVAMHIAGVDTEYEPAIGRVSRHEERVQRLHNVAATATFTPTASQDQYLAVGHRMYYEKRWDNACEAYTLAGKAGKPALFALHVLRLDFASALKLAVGGLHPVGSAHVDYVPGANNVKGMPFPNVCNVYSLITDQVHHR